MKKLLTLTKVMGLSSSLVVKSYSMLSSRILVVFDISLLMPKIAIALYFLSMKDQ